MPSRKPPSPQAIASDSLTYNGIIQDLRNGNLSYRMIGRKWQCSAQTVCNIAKRVGIARPGTQAQVVANLERRGFSKARRLRLSDQAFQAVEDAISTCDDSKGLLYLVNC